MRNPRLFRNTERNSMAILISIVAFLWVSLYLFAILRGPLSDSGDDDDYAIVAVEDAAAFVGEVHQNERRNAALTSLDEHPKIHVAFDAEEKHEPQIKQPPNEKDKNLSKEETLQSYVLLDDEFYNNTKAPNAHRTLMIYYNSPVSAFMGKYMLTPMTEENCGVSCQFSEDYEAKENATAIVFHLPQQSLPSFIKRSDQYSVVYTMEFVGRNFEAIREKADMEMSYRLKADIWTPYFSYRIPFRQIPEKKTALVAAFISNCNSKNLREKYLQELMTYIPVHSYGGCYHNIEGGKGEKMDILKSYKFYLAFENQNEEDYVTEKIYHALRVGSVPIYMGAPNVESFVPHPSSIINTNNFPGPRELADFLLELDQDDEKYNKYLEWKTKPFSEEFLRLRRKTKLDARCRLCRLMHEKVVEKEDERRV